MAIIKRDGNFSTGETRQGMPIHFFRSIANADITANVWYRLCWSGGAATKQNERSLDLGTIPSWAKPNDFSGWQLKILNAGYNGDGGESPPYYVEEMTSGGVVTLERQIRHYSALPTGVEWVIYPELVFPLTIVLSPDSTQGMEIGLTFEDAYTPLSGVRKIAELKKQTFPVSKQFRGTSVDRVWYRFVTSTGAQEFEWGEGELGSG